MSINDIENLLKSARDRQLPPVDQWDPPHCGDIGMKIARNGVWYYQGSPIGRKPLVKLFASVLRKDADEQHYLVTPVEKIVVEVEDAPFLAVEMNVLGSGADRQIIFRTNVDDVVEVGSGNPLRFEVEQHSGGLKPYVRVRGRLEALLTRALYYDLVALAEQTPGTEKADTAPLGIWAGGEFYELSDNTQRLPRSAR